MMLFPGLFLLLTTVAFNLVGDGLRDALDPHPLPVRPRPSTRRRWFRARSAAPRGPRTERITVGT
jgi:hypothetical protein